MFKQFAYATESDDATLVMCSLGGDKDAFCSIVSRYQNLLCSLAYSSLGDIKHSEDVAQETFVEAWKKLDSLREPHKLKSWLCGILRFKVSHYVRKEKSQPASGAEEVDEHEGSSSEAHELEQGAIEAQHQALLWKTLQGMEETYREPLVLFYRENQSVEQVAAELDLSKDTAKQRLSRGRKLLQQTMQVFVEEALAKSRPGAAFTAAVLTSISSLPAPAKAAALGASAAKTGSLFSIASFITVLSSVSGVISGLFGLQAGLAQSRTITEKQYTKKVVAGFFLIALLYVAGMLGLRWLGLNRVEYSLPLTVLSQVVVLGFVLCYLSFTTTMYTSMRRLRAQQRIFHPEEFYRESDKPDSTKRERKSRLTLFGVPLLHVQFAMDEQTDKPVFAWIAVGEKAYGLLFAWGAFAVAPISVGIVSVGIVSIGVVGAGLVGLGTVGIGLIGFGASAIAYKAYGSLSAMGWDSAFSNGFSIAQNGAIGPIAYAQQINNDSAAAIVDMAALSNSYLWVLAAISVLVIVPSAWYAKKVKQQLAQ